jgi:hypothetical protein
MNGKEITINDIKNLNAIVVAGIGDFESESESTRFMNDDDLVRAEYLWIIIEKELKNKIK